MRRPEVGFGPLAGAEEAGPEPALLEQPAVPDAEARVGGEGLGNVGRVGEGDADGHGSEVSGQLGRRPVMGRSGERDPGDCWVLRNLGSDDRDALRVKATGSGRLRVWREREREKVVLALVS